MKISVIVPVYNADKYIEKCLDSIIHQTYQDIEVICINGSSEDKSLQILNKYAEQDGRIKVHTKPNEGVSLSRNRGIDLAEGEYIMFVDADDWIEEETCETVLQEMEQSQADVVMWSYIREFGETSLPKKIFPQERIIFEGEEVQKRLHRRFIGLVGEEMAQVENADALCPVWGKMYRRSIIEKCQIRFADIREIGTYEDGFFNLEYFAYAKKAVFIDRCLYHYRKDNQNSITSKYKAKLFQQWLELFGRMRRYIEERELPMEYRIALNNRICLSVLGQGLNILESPKGFWEKKRELKQIIMHTAYRKAYREFALKYFPIHWKCFYGCAKKGWAAGVYVLLVCIRKMIGK